MVVFVLGVSVSIKVATASLVNYKYVSCELKCLEVIEGTLKLVEFVRYDGMNGIIFLDGDKGGIKKLRVAFFKLWYLVYKKTKTN